MADNVKASTDPTVAADEVGSVYYQRVKIVWGADNTVTDASAAAPLPVVQTGELPTGTKTIGNVTLAAGTAEIGKVKVTELPATPTGTNSIGKIKSVEEALPAGTNWIGDVGLRPRETSGLEKFRSLSVTTTDEQVKGSAGMLYGYYFMNAAAAVRYLKFYNATSASVTVGTTEPFLTLPLPKESAGHIWLGHGITFGTAITVGATKGLADNNSEAPAANEVILNVFYK